jgi:hypothetical protein
MTGPDFAAMLDKAAFYVKGLGIVFGDEWHALSIADRCLILRDCTEEGGVDDLAEYRRNIGCGNLQAYANTQRVRFAQSGDSHVQA